MDITTKKFWVDAGIRVLNTVTQTAMATMGTSALISDVNWKLVCSASALAGILSLLYSINRATAESNRIDNKEDNCIEEEVCE